MTRISKNYLSILLILSLIAGIFIFEAARYIPFSLVIHTKTLEKGTRYIVATGEGSNRLSQVRFEIGSDAGEPSVYTIELPRKKWQSVTIPPLATPGKYEIERITLANDTVSYSWEVGTACTKELSGGGISRQTPCDPGSPAVTVGSDSSVVITSIPDSGLYNSYLFSFTAAFVTLLCLIGAGLYLLWPSAEGKGWQRYAARGLWLLLILLYLYQCRYIGSYSVDLPFWEEWEFFEPGALQRGLSWDWLFCHFGTNQQVMVFTKLMAWLNFKLFSLDFVKLKVMNYAVFGLLLLAVSGFARRVAGNSFWFFPLFMIFLVSPLAYEAHAASFQSGEIFVLLFMLGMLNYSIPPQFSYRDTLLFSGAALCAIFSMHTGLAVVPLLLICRTVYITSAILGKKLQRREGLEHALISWLLILPGFIFWLSGYRKPSAAAPPWLLPTEGKFWDQFFNLLGFGFGFDEPNPLPGVVCLLLVAVPVILLLKKRSTRRLATTWQIVPAILALLSVTLMITMGRGNMAGSIKLSRYTVYISLLIPFGALAWWLVLKEGRHRLTVLAIFWILCCGAFADNWSYAIYRDLRQLDLINIECVARYSSGMDDGTCPGTHGVPIGVFFDNARKLDIHFTRRFAPPLQPK